MNPLEKFRKECQEIAGEYSRLLEKPKEHADLALPCFVLAKELQKSPVEIASNISKEFQDKIKHGSLVKEVKVVGPYINFYINHEEFSKQVLAQVIKEKKKYGSSKKNKQKIMVEFAHPNTHKLFHIGHLRNITTGESLSRILEFNGSKVIRANYQGDVGMHIAKCIWGIRKLGMIKTKKLDDKIRFLGKAYATGSKAFEEDDIAKQQIIEINKHVYNKDKKIMKLWKTTRKWSLEYFNRIYKRVYTKFDRLYFESEVATSGKTIALESVKDGILKESDGAIIFEGEKYNLHNRVFINSAGLPTYEAKDLGLAKLQLKEFGPDLIVHVLGPEQLGYTQVLFKVLEEIFPKMKNKQFHLAYGWVKLREGKMSSRTGNVIEGEWLLDELKKTILEKYPKSKKISESIAIAAAKYYFLKVSTPTEISFDINEAVSLEGNTGPYIEYTYARANSILKKSKKKPKIKTLKDQLEMNLTKKISEFPETVEKSAKDLKPNLIANYTYDLATLFNEYYQTSRIIGNENEQAKLTLVLGVKQVLENSLNLLGIKPLEKM
ncbi:MAG: arginine--tRNA ligase [Candidatus Aenigmarchaeota archaeon]|nr:arginine--tRNA ligase [Candidatus Aenigmarchaeota archaeon]